ncbi:acyltransferase [Mucilaginibacter sp.]|uniref:acyltransferase n=1 Tax=Mucilaginibacter sp. TaxID=1882438 RepID=UPI00284D3376|nr:acyltransferase [Mucilaginibacter sp.]MDR3697544.1 acyltransferase [Mucilaginibacter sp.]
MNFKIGKGSSIHLGCHFNTSGLFSMKENSTINQFCHIDNRGGVEIGSNVSLSPKVSLITADHNLDDENNAGRVGKIVIEDYVFVGYGASVLKGSTLKIGSVLGAMSLMTGSTEAYGIYFGVPATFKKSRNKNLTYKCSYKRLFH